MAQIRNITRYKKSVFLVGIIIFAIVLAEGLIFNREYFLRRFSGLEERYYSMQDGIIFQFAPLKESRLGAQSNDPNITFENINTQVESILIRCDNSIPEAFSQLFYRFGDESFSEARSIIYNAKMKGALVNLPVTQTISSLRFDLTNMEGDVVTCKEFVINPYVPFDRNPTRWGGYLFSLLGVFLISLLNITTIKDILAGIQKIEAKSFDVRLDIFASKLNLYLKENIGLILVLSAIALAAYGFELFNLNLTIDEEYYAFADSVGIGWIGQGRWGMYFLNKYLLPYNVVPFVPLGIALFCQIAGILLMLKSWGVKSKLEQIAVGSIGLTFPGLAYVYTFSTLNYGIGVGLFCISLSLFLYTRSAGSGKFLAIIPATFAISIYQGFIPALVLIYLVFLIIIGIREEKNMVKHLLAITGIHVLSALLYYIILKLLFVYYNIGLSGYITGFFSARNFFDNLPNISSSFFNMMTQAYFGDKSIYTFDVGTLKILLFVALLGLTLSLLRSRSSIASRVFVILLSLSLLLLPFISGFFMNGIYGMRFLIGLPIALSGITMIGMIDNPKIYKILVSILAIACVYQFTISTNRLFASSHLALQADRLLASSLIERIQEAKTEAGTNETLKYMEMIGYLDRPATELVPKASTFGASFFEWNLGNTSRALAFMKTIGYQGLNPLPDDRRGQFISIAETMPVWPEEGSVKIIGDTALVKFGPYSQHQKLRICSVTPVQETIHYQDLCK